MHTGFALDSAGLISFVALLLSFGLIYSTGAVTLFRISGGNRLWGAWVVVVVLLTALWVVRLAPYGLNDGGTPLLMILPFIGIPTALTNLVTVRLGRCSPAPTIIRQVVIAFGAYLMALPIGAIVGAVPDMLRFFM